MREISVQLTLLFSSPPGKPEGSLQIDQISATLLKILVGEGSSSPPQKFIQQLQLGQLLKGQVIQIFSEGTKALLNFEGQKIVVQGDPSFKTGQTISAKVEQISPAPVLRIISPSELGRSPGKEMNAKEITGTQLKQETTIQISSGKSSPISYFSKHGLDFLKFSERQTYPAQIKKVLDSESAIVQLKNRNFFVQTLSRNSLKPGDQIPVVTEKTANGLFHFLQSNGPVIKQMDAGMIKPYLPARMPFGEMITKLETVFREISSNSDSFKLDSEKLAQLNQTLQLLSPGNGKTASAQLLRDQVNASGINYEARVKQFLEQGANQGKAMELGRDLKGQLLDMIQKLEDQVNQAKGFSSTQLKTLNEHAQVFRQAVENIELHQLTNQLARQENQSVLLQIPNPFGQGNSTIKLYVRSSGDEESGKKGVAKKSYNLVFFLDLSMLGNLRVDSQVSQTQLSVKIQVENQSIADFINSRTEEFNTRLADLGFQVDLKCCVEDKIELDFENELSAILFQDETRLVDVTT